VPGVAKSPSWYTDCSHLYVSMSAALCLAIRNLDN